MSGGKRMENFYLIIHGHFYQPPREEPYSLEIERQIGAFPFENWNQKINRECYAANAASRVLDERGRIIDIINNYEYISFNFGPTLLSWIKKEDPFTYENIIEADKKSRERNNGHGNAIAQVYNHIILPLACDKDIITEIEWGLTAFEKDFGRKSEGIWLSETAISSRVIQFLEEYDIKFLILSPFQAEEVRNKNTGEWKKVSDGTIDFSKPYFLEESDKIAVFFYNREIATKVSFEHLLKNVEFLRGEILKYRNSRLVHFATDGEVYGHHEPFGDMCLARLIYENRERRDFIFTNYANFLEKFPPENYVILKKGNDGLGTSWSCIHGVDRWRKDCGCSTGGQKGWNQKWREPLRNAFDFLRDRLFEKAEEFLPEYLKDLWVARNEYINVICSDDYVEWEKRVREFLKKHLKLHVNDEVKVKILKFFEAFRMELFMYTSCGWFFADISGLETVQNLKYANQLILLMEDFFDESVKNEFLSILSRAKSNLSEYGNGRVIFEDFVEKKHLSLEKILFEYALQVRENDIYKNNIEYYYFYKLKVIDYTEIEKNGCIVKRFLVESKNILTEEENTYILLLLFYDRKYFAFVKKFKDNYFLKYLDKIIKGVKADLLQELKDFLGNYYTLKDISQNAREKLLKFLFKDKMKKLHKYLEFSKNEFLTYLDLIELYGDLKIPIPEIDRLVIRELLNSFILQELSKIRSIDIEKYDFSLLVKTINLAKKAQLKLDYTDILPVIKSYVSENMEAAIVRLELKPMKKLEKIIDIANLSGIDFEKYEIQNLIFKKVKELSRDSATLKKEEVILLFELARKFNIGVDEIF